MAKRKTQTTTEDLQEGDRLPGEAVPEDDSHLQNQLADAINATIGEGDQDDEEGSQSDEGPGDDGEEGPELVKIMLGGQVIEVAPEVAEAYERERASYQQPPPDDEADEGPDDTQSGLGDLLYTDPEGAVRQITETVRSQVSKELREEYIAERAREIFWQDFYRMNPDLQEDDAIVQAVLNKNLGSIRNLSGDAGRTVLADMTRKEIMKVAKRHGGTSRKRDDSDTLEGSGNRRQQRPRRTTPEETNVRPLTMGDALRERRLRRMRQPEGQSA